MTPLIGDPMQQLVMQKLLEHQMTRKEARKIMLWRAIERYRTAGGREEHHAYKEALDNYIDDMLDIEEMDEVAHRFAHPLALELECVLADRNVNWDRAMNLIGEYRSAMNAIHERHSPTFMGEPLIHADHHGPDWTQRDGEYLK